MVEVCWEQVNSQEWQDNRQKDCLKSRLWKGESKQRIGFAEVAATNRLRTRSEEDCGRENPGRELGSLKEQLLDAVKSLAGP